MTFTYTNDPENVAVDAVRLLVGDTSSPGDLSDEEIEYFLARYDDNAGRAALAAVGVLIAKFAKDVDKQVGDLRIFSSQKVRGYERARQFIETIVSTYDPVGMWAGGVSRSERAEDDANTDLQDPYFRRRMHDFDEYDEYGTVS